MKISDFKIICISFLLFSSCSERIFLPQKVIIKEKINSYSISFNGFKFNKIIIENDSIKYFLYTCDSLTSFNFYNFLASDYKLTFLDNADTLYAENYYFNTKINEKSLEIEMLDVHQGDSFVIIPPNSIPSIVDGGYGSHGHYSWQGGGKKIAEEELISQNIFSLNKMIETHKDLDHRGGLLDIISNNKFSYNEYLSPDSSQYLEVNDTIFFSDEIFGVVLSINQGKDENNRSIVFKLKYHSFDMLFTGDMETEVENYILNNENIVEKLKCEVLTQVRQ